MLAASYKIKAKEAFDDKLLLFAESEDIPFAYRAPAPENISYCLSEGRKIEKIGQFEISEADQSLICRFTGKPSLAALIAPLEDNTDISDKADTVIGYLRAAYSLELSQKQIERFEDFTVRIAERCGCLTDIYREDTVFSPLADSIRPDSAFIAVCMPIIALMYRRISALRGFNFKIAIKDELPCLVFSAKVILSDSDSAIPEMQVLCRIAESDKPSFIHRLVDLGEKCDCGKLYRLSVAVCSQTVDPHGILRAPEWKKHTDNILSKIDLDVPGRF